MLKVSNEMMYGALRLVSVGHRYDRWLSKHGFLGGKSDPRSTNVMVKYSQVLENLPMEALGSEQDGIRVSNGDRPDWMTWEIGWLADPLQRGRQI